MFNPSPGLVSLRSKASPTIIMYCGASFGAGIEEKKNSYTMGCLWELGENHLQSLDRYEAVTEGYYDRSTVQVMLLPSNVEEETIVYLSNNRKYGRPTTHYQNEVIEGAGHVGLPEDYIQKLVKWSLFDRSRDEE